MALQFSINSKIEEPKVVEMQGQEDGCAILRDAEF